MAAEILSSEVREITDLFFEPAGAETDFTPTKEDPKEDSAPKWFPRRANPPIVPKVTRSRR